MDSQYITGVTWERLRIRHPNAYHFLLRESLKQELATLQEVLTKTKDERRIAWINARITELKTLTLTVPAETCEHPEVTVQTRLYRRETYWTPAEYEERIACCECGIELDRTQLDKNTIIHEEK